MSQVTIHSTKQSALTVIDAINLFDEMRYRYNARTPEWTLSVVQNADGYWVVQIHDENDEFVGTL